MMRIWRGVNRCSQFIKLCQKASACGWTFSATPKGTRTECTSPGPFVYYPLAQAVEDRIVKAPIIVTKEDDLKQPKEDPDHITKDNVAEKYGYWLRSGSSARKDHFSVYKKLDTKPVLFIMAEKNVYADALGEYLWKTKEFGFLKNQRFSSSILTPRARLAKQDLDSPCCCS